MANPLSRRAFWAGIVTLTSANTNYNLRELVNAELSASGAEVPDSFREILITANPGVDGAGQNTNDVLLGDSSLSASVYGWVLSVGSSTPFRSTIGNVQFSPIYARSGASGQKVCIVLMAA